jgi:DNA-binding response OmpR family regulator
MILTTLGDDESRVKSLRLGAHDFVVRPFSPLVLAARVQAL